MTLLICAICGSTKKTQHLYGVDSCNRCVMRHRNDCRKMQKSPKNYFGNPNCEFCCFKKNLLTSTPPPKPIVTKYESLDNIIQEVALLDDRREFTYSNRLFKTHISIDNAIQCSFIKFGERPENKALNFEEWSIMNQLSIIEFFKSFGFIKKLTTDDRTKFIRGVRFRCAIFSTAFRSFNNKKGYLELYDNMDIFPSSMIQDQSNNHLDSIRCRLVSRIIDLNITRQEFLLLMMLHLFVNEIKDISSGGAAILHEQRRLYGSALFDHCILKDPRTGSSRYVDLLSICQATQRTHSDIEGFTLLFRVAHPNNKGNDLIKFE